MTTIKCIRHSSVGERYIDGGFQHIGSMMDRSYSIYCYFKRLFFIRKKKRFFFSLRHLSQSQKKMCYIFDAGFVHSI